MLTALPRNSIRWRLILAGVATLAGALLAAGWGFSVLFERHVERRVVAELETDIRHIMSGLVIDAHGAAKVERTPADLRYTQPLSGRYWQLEVEDKIVAKARSLWDESLDTPVDTVIDGSFHIHKIKGPRDAQLIAVERAFSVARATGKQRFCVTAALDAAEIYAAVGDFRRELAVALTILGVVLLASFAIAVQVGLRPLSHLRGALARLHAGDERRLSGRFPDEVEPLVTDLNKVLEQRERAATRAKACAADLAHGLKTPLTAIEVVADELRGKGEEALGIELSDYVADMQGHVERELALARSAVADMPVSDVNVAGLVAQLTRSLHRLPRGNSLAWQVEISPQLVYRGHEALLAEILGNLLDNARKWAKSRILVRAERSGQTISIAVDDDGPGVAEKDIPHLLTRGKRLDESVPGTGFGLSIVGDMLEQAGGQLKFMRAELGGLGVRVTLPG